jgi:hypothetical protein
MVPSKSSINGSPLPVKIWPIADKATNVPAMEVHSPGMRRTPDAMIKAEVMVVLMGEPLHNVNLDRTTNAEPPTRRMRSKLMSGQPPANVEYRHRKDTPFCPLQIELGGAADQAVSFGVDVREL